MEKKTCSNAIVTDSPLKAIICKHTDLPCICSYTMGFRPFKLNDTWVDCPGTYCTNQEDYNMMARDYATFLIKNAELLEQIRVMNKELTRLKRLERRQQARYERNEKMIWGNQ